jgi:hypothetical protein
MHSKFVPLTLVALLAAACGGSSQNATQSGPSFTGTVALTLFDQNGTSVLPTYISHIISSTTYPLAKLALTNTGSQATTYTVTVDFPTYGSPATQTVTVDAGATQSVTLSPIINYASLFALTTAVPGALNVTVTAGGTTLLQKTFPLQLSGRDTVFWLNGGQPIPQLVATMVTPNDSAGRVNTLAHDAGLLFPVNALLGYQGGAAFPTQTVANAIAPGTYTSEGFQVLAGDSISVTIDTVTNGVGGADAATVAILDDANFTTFTSGGTASACVSNTTAAAGSVVSCALPAAGIWHIVYFNPGTNLTSRTITRHRSMGKWETTYEQTRAIFTALRNQGMIYANLPGAGSYFSGTQNVMYPQESLAVNNANCIEGSLVFDSVWERMGMEPILVVDFAHGHAFTAVRCWAGDTCVIPVETTMVGGTATFDQAAAEGTAKWNAWTSVGDNTATLIDLKAVRAAGITPAPM